MAVTDAGTNVPLYPYHTFYTYSYSNQPNNYFYTQIGLQFRQDQLWIKNNILVNPVKLSLAYIALNVQSAQTQPLSLYTPLFY